ncbi:hypothetical protein [Riemerella anatipestifer]|uniref:hypothetical protein n=1 Tax=Riemerella anatipestifer TaxID=34085 RepID=UPI001FB0D0AD|nr:hypothetical protein [Riemerella anatipestifer]
MGTFQTGVSFSVWILYCPLQKSGRTHLARKSTSSFLSILYTIPSGSSTLSIVGVFWFSIGIKSSVEMASPLWSSLGLFSS